MSLHGPAVRKIPPRPCAAIRSVISASIVLIGRMMAGDDEDDVAQAAVDQGAHGVDQAEMVAPRRHSAGHQDKTFVANAPHLPQHRHPIGTHSLGIEPRGVHDRRNDDDTFGRDIVLPRQQVGGVVGLHVGEPAANECIDAQSERRFRGRQPYISGHNRNRRMLRRCDCLPRCLCTMGVHQLHSLAFQNVFKPPDVAVPSKKMHRGESDIHPLAADCLQLSDQRPLPTRDQCARAGTQQRKCKIERRAANTIVVERRHREQDRRSGERARCDARCLSILNHDAVQTAVAAWHNQCASLRSLQALLHNSLTSPPRKQRDHAAIAQLTADFRMSDAELTFLPFGTGAGQVKLAVRSRAGKGPGPGIMWLGGFKSDMKGTKAAALDQWAAEHGRACVRFDYSGRGKSEGAFVDGTIGRWLAEGVAVFDAFCREAFIVVGSSMGGWLALLLARELSAVPTLGAQLQVRSRRWF